MIFGSAVSDVFAPSLIARLPVSEPAFNALRSGSKENFLSAYLIEQASNGEIVLEKTARALQRQ